MKAHELIDSPEKWTTGAMARNADGRGVNPRSLQAVCFCAMGAITSCYGINATTRQLIDLVKVHINNSSLSDWNDRAGWQTVYSTLKEMDI